MPREASSKSSPRSQDVSKIETITRKKKNAIAQAAFRERKAHYLDTLEVTVTNLEAIISCLQDASREKCTELQELQAKHNQLYLEYQAREMYWREWCQSKGVQCQLPEMPPSLAERMRREAEFFGSVQYKRHVAAMDNLVVMDSHQDSEHDHRHSLDSHESTTESYRLSQSSYESHRPSEYGLAANVDHHPSLDSPANVNRRPLGYIGTALNAHNRPSYESPANADQHPLKYGKPPANDNGYEQLPNADHHPSERNHEPTASVGGISQYTYPLPLRFRSSPEPISAPNTDSNDEMSNTSSDHVGCPISTRGLQLPHGEGTSHNGTAASDRYVFSSFSAHSLPIHLEPTPTSHASASTSTRSHTMPAIAVVSRHRSPPPVVDTIEVLKAQCFGAVRQPRKNSRKPPATVAETVSNALDARFSITRRIP